MSAVAVPECITIDDSLTICTGPRGIYGRRLEPCPVCKGLREQVYWWGGAYYGHTVTCVGCGDSWTEGERHERPFRRGWRKEAIADAKRCWVAGQPWGDYLAAVRASVEAEMGWVR